MWTLLWVDRSDCSTADVTCQEYVGASWGVKTPHPASFTQICMPLWRNFNDERFLISFCDFLKFCNNISHPFAFIKLNIVSLLDLVLKDWNGLFRASDDWLSWNIILISDVCFVPFFKTCFRIRSVNKLWGFDSFAGQGFPTHTPFATSGSADNPRKLILIFYPLLMSVTLDCTSVLIVRCRKGKWN
jgi:hypothetical protein